MMKLSESCCGSTVCLKIIILLLEIFFFFFFFFGFSSLRDLTDILVERIAAIFVCFEMTRIEPRSWNALAINGLFKIIHAI